MNELPHTREPIVDDFLGPGSLDDKDSRFASKAMRAWMESVSDTLTQTDYLGQSSDITTSGNIFIEATDAITITLNPSAIHNESVTVYRNTLLGNPSITDGIGTDIIALDQTVISYRYKDTLGWIRGA